MSNTSQFIGELGAKHLLSKIKKLENTPAISSWNDLTDKPFYETTELGVILPEASYTTEASLEGARIYTDFILEAGKTYTIVMNGENLGEYVAQVNALDSTTVSIYVNTIGIHYYGSNLREEFGCIGAIEYVTTNGTVFTLEILGEVPKIVTIDPKFIKDMYYTEDDGDGEVLPEITALDPNANEPVADKLYLDTTEGNSMLFYTGIIPITIGETYTVKWNGVEYKCVAGTYEEEGMTAAVLGNIGLMTDGTSTEEPFILIFLSEMQPDIFYGVIGIPLDGSTSVTLGIYGNGETIHQIHPKYIPDMYSSEHVEGYVLNSTTVSIENLIGRISSPFSLEVGATYLVNWDGEEYEVVAEQSELGIGLTLSSQFQIIIINDPQIFSQIGSKYVVICYDSSITTTTLSIYENRDKIIKIKDKYLPDSIARTEYVDSKIESEIDKVTSSTNTSITNTASSLRTTISATENRIDKKYASRLRIGSIPEDQTKFSSICKGTYSYYACSKGMIKYSDDGTSWYNALSESLPMTENSIICYSSDNKKYILAGGTYIYCLELDSSNRRLVKGSDTIISVNTYWRSVCYGNGKFIIVGYRDDSTDQYILYSDDGITWTQAALPVTADWYSVCYGNDKFVVVGSNSTILYSEDGITWTQATSPSVSDSETTTVSYGSICYGNDRFVAIRTTSSTTSDNLGVEIDYAAAYSDDGINWVRSELKDIHTSFTDLSGRLKNICYGKNKYIAVGYRTNALQDYFIAAYSEDGIDWKVYHKSEAEQVFPESICYGNYGFVAAGNYVAHSKDGIAWVDKAFYDGINGNLIRTDEVVDLLTYYMGSASSNNNILNGQYRTGSIRTTGSQEESSDYALGFYAFAEGRLTEARGENAHAEGYNTKASGHRSHAEGNSTEASGNDSHAEGNQTIASKYGSHAEGDSTEASGNSSHAEGYNTKASEYGSHAEGYKTEASGAYGSHAEGYMTKATSQGSHSEGADTIASGAYSHAEGQSTTASGYRSHAEGWNTEASGNGSHAEGADTIASGAYSHAEGQSTTASGSYGAHAEGRNTIASGSYGSHAEGEGTISSGGYGSHAEGWGTHASGSFGSHAEGEGTISSSRSQHVQGTYNIYEPFNISTTISPKVTLSFSTYFVSETYTFNEITGLFTLTDPTELELASITADDIINKYITHLNPNDELLKPISIAISTDENKKILDGEIENIKAGTYNKYAHIVGNGTNDDSRSNAHTVDWDGNAWYAGDVYVGGTSQDDENAKKLVTLEDIPNNSNILNGQATGSLRTVGSYSNNASYTIGEYAFAEGQYTIASGHSAHAEGQNTKSLGYGAHAEGAGSNASGYGAHAEGQYTIASGSHAHAEGTFTIAKGNDQHVQGKFNIEDSLNIYSHIVGNGTSDTERSNAHTLDWNGVAWYASDVYVGGTSQDDENAKKLATEEFVDNAISELTTLIQNHINDADNPHNIINKIQDNSDLVNTELDTTSTISEEPEMSPAMEAKFAQMQQEIDELKALVASLTQQ